MGQPYARWICCAGLLAVLSAGPVTSARACGGLDFTCIGSYVAPSSGTIPANAPAIAFYDFHRATQARDLVSLMDASERVLAIDLIPDPANPRHWLIRPLDPLETGYYQIRHRSSCAPIAALAAFQVGEARALPSTAGTVRLETTRRMRVDFGTTDGCQVAGDAAVLPIVFEPSETMRGWLPLAHFSLSIDGRPWASSGYGSDRSPTPSPFHAGSGLSVFQPYSFCDGVGNDGQPGTTVTGRSGGLQPGSHRAELTMHIAGAQADPPPIGFEFSLACDTAPASSGCSLGDGHDPGDGSWIFTLLAGVVLVLRRRRTPRLLR
jgi:MYXO-CTERM domain-containing protein